MSSFKILVRKFEPFEKSVQQFWDEYEQKHATGLTLELVALDLPELHEAIMSGDFDLAHVNTDWLAQCNANNTLEDLAPYLRDDPPEDYPHGWAPAHLSLQTFGEKVIGVPFHDGPECLIYRKDLFENVDEKATYLREYGTELKPPETWEEFARVAKFFNRPEQKLYGTIFALFPDGHNNVFDFAIQVWSRGGSLVDKDGNITVYSPEAVSAMEFYRNILNQPFLHPECRDFDSISSGWAFAGGEAALMVNWFGFAALCETDEKSKIRGCVDITSIPHAENCSDPVSLCVYYTWSISSRSSRKKEAYEYILNATTKENDVKLTIGGSIGCRKSTWIDSGVNKLIPYYNRMDDVLGYAKTLPRVPNWHDVSVLIDRLVLDVLNTEKPVEDILKQAQQEINKL